MSSLHLPHSVHSLNSRKSAFIDFIEARGGEILETTNPYEVMRFRGASGVAVVYRTKTKKLTWDDRASEAWRAFKLGTAWHGVEKRHSTSRALKKRNNMIATLIKRDGMSCIYCASYLTSETLTIEHFMPLSAGGKHHTSNLGLSCDTCNQAVGHKPIASKIKYALEKQA